jgi:hypothetical protein
MSELCDKVLNSVDLCDGFGRMVRTVGSTLAVSLLEDRRVRSRQAMCKWFLPKMC